MLNIRKAHERGHFDHGWLDTWHSFSFASYYDPSHMGVSHLRVINDDRIAPGVGFPTHPHEDMEIVTYVMEGALAHRDSMGNGTTIRTGEVQRMSAGTGITHSEFNASESEPVHLLQIWILPERKGLTPSYEQRAFPAGEKRGRLRLIASRDGADGSITLHQDTRIFAALLGAGERLEQPLAVGRIGYLQVARGEVRMNGQRLTAGDGATIRGEAIALEGGDGAEVLLFDLVDHPRH